MGKRKTITVLALLESVNHRNRHSTCPADVRSGWNSILEEFLQDTGNYNGFGYLRSRDVPDGCLPGIEGTCSPITFPDESRRIYYTR